MSDFFENEASDREMEYENEQPTERRKKPSKRKPAVMDSDSETDNDEDEDEDQQEDVKDLIDDAPINESDSDSEDSSDNDSGTDGDEDKPKKRKRDDDCEEGLEDDDYDLIEENLGVKIVRNKKYKRLRRISDDEDEGEQRDTIANQLFVAGSDEDEEGEVAQSDVGYDEENENESDVDDFIVDANDQPIAKHAKKRPRVFTDTALQEGQDIFGVNFDYEEFEKYGGEEGGSESENEDEYSEGEDDPQRLRQKKSKGANKKSIFEVYEPSELRRNYFTDLDNEIRKTDLPERMQIREVPITPVEEGSSELQEEAEWIYKQAFLRPPVSKTDSQEARERTRRSPSTVEKIQQTLDFIRNQKLEVPFIAFYRKEYVQPELSINDLWKVYKYDTKWCQLKQRKENLLKLVENMREFQLNKLLQDPDAPIPDNVRLIRDEDLERLKSVQTAGELRDVHSHFLLHFSHEIPEMQKVQREKDKKRDLEERKRRACEEAERNGEDTKEAAMAVEVGELEKEPPDQIKCAIRSGSYELCRKTGIESLVKMFGLTSGQFAENVRDNYQRHEVEQSPIPPTEAAAPYASVTRLEEVLRRAVYMCGVQLAREPLLRTVLRDALRDRATLSVRPTPRGLKEIDESHPCYSFKYLEKKPVRDLTGDQYLKLTMAVENKLLEMNINEEIKGTTGPCYLKELQQLYRKDEYSATVTAWNDLRAEAVSIAFTKIVMPEMRRELNILLLQESKEYVLKCCRRRLYDWLKVAPYESRLSVDDDEEWDTSKGLRVLSIAYVPDRQHSGFACVVGGGGELADHLRLPHLLYRRNAWDALERQNKEADMTALRRFILHKKPHVIVIGGESREALNVKADVTECVQQLVEDEQFPRIPIEIADNHISKIYSNSIRGHNDFREYPEVLRQAICQARLLQDPLMEISQLCGPDEEILCIQYHPLQGQIAKETLMEGIELEFINRVNEVGVDINKTILTGRGTELLQFVCGLGPRKADSLIKRFKQVNQKLENRTQLVTLWHMGPTVFINCSGFIKIDTNTLGDSTEVYIEVLDGSRIHPETYEWARKMALDALEFEEEDADPVNALDEILANPSKLKDLDLDAFSEELQRQGYGNKCFTLYDIREELNSKYKDLRVPYRSLTSGELFDVLSKETIDTFYVGKMMLASVVGFTYRKPQKDVLDEANPIRNVESGLWKCPFCNKKDFLELSEVWNHFDAGTCPGQATGVRVRLDNGLSGFIHIKNLSDRHVTDPTERVRIGQTIHCRVLKIDVERFSVECSSKSFDLMDKDKKWRPTKDPYYYHEAEDKDLRKDVEMKQNKERGQYLKRVIVHPSFRNISYADAEKLMENMGQGEVIVRPSSKGSDHLTVTWKVADGIYQHIDVREEGKVNDFSLGRKLWIQETAFEDLDEIIAQYVTPMAGLARDLIAYKYYRPLLGMRDKAEEILKAEKAKNPNKIHYVISAAKNYPGRFLLTYLPSTRCTHEYISVMSDGLKFRQRLFDSLDRLLIWFKDHYREPPPGYKPMHRNPTESVPAHNTPTMHTPAYHMTAHAPSTACVSTPYTPSAQTPYMTPVVTTPDQPDFPVSYYQPAFMPPPAVPVAPHLDWQKAAAEWIQHGIAGTMPHESSASHCTPQRPALSNEESKRSTLNPYTAKSLGNNTPLRDEN